VIPDDRVAEIEANDHAARGVVLDDPADVERRVDTVSPVGVRERCAWPSHSKRVLREEQKARPDLGERAQPADAHAALGAKESLHLVSRHAGVGMNRQLAVEIHERDEMPDRAAAEAEGRSTGAMVAAAYLFEKRIGDKGARLQPLRARRRGIEQGQAGQQECRRSHSSLLLLEGAIRRQSGSRARRDGGRHDTLGYRGYMSKPPDLVQGTLDLLLLKIIALEPLHGWAIAQRLKQVSGDVLQVSEGSLYPALHKLEQEGWITAKWRVAETGRRAKYYTLSLAGRRELEREAAKWERLAGAISKVVRLKAV
jgi:PadR family transcriptional regulator PadR